MSLLAELVKWGLAIVAAFIAMTIIIGIILFFSVLALIIPIVTGVALIAAAIYFGLFTKPDKPKDEDNQGP